LDWENVPGGENHTFSDTLKETSFTYPVSEELKEHTMEMFQYCYVSCWLHNESFVEYIYDSATYKILKSKIPGDSNMILLQVCWDGA
jgi:hypothetical protein